MPDTPEGAARAPLPCPFCGTAPTVQHRRSGWRVACDNDDCPTMPNGFTFEERGGAVEGWNTPFAAALAALKEWHAAGLTWAELLKVPREERASEWQEKYLDAMERRAKAEAILCDAAAALPKETEGEA